jgi:hypothetical protein
MLGTGLLLSKTKKKKRARNHTMRGYMAKTSNSHATTALQQNKKTEITTRTYRMEDSQQSLYNLLDENIRKKGLTDLHTHLMGMGSANFWVKKIIEKYIPLKEEAAEKGSNFVKYPLLDLLIATGVQPAPEGSFERSIQYSRLESRFFDSIEKQNFESFFRENKKPRAVLEEPPCKKNRRSSSSGGGGGGESSEQLEGDKYITNSQLLMMLDLDANSTNPGNLMSIIRNCFEFLSKAGTDPTAFDFHSCKC